MTFDEFYEGVFRAEHRDPRNVALHMVGTVASGVWAGACFSAGWPWVLGVLLYPVVHAGPGLVGHRLFERNESVGDLRVTRRDFPGWWFVAGNHRMLWELVRGRAG